MIKNVLDLNKIPSKVYTEELSVHQAVYELSEFILVNKYIFGLQKIDEDFANDIILSFLEKGQIIFDTYDIKSGSFFNYLYSYLKNLIYTKSRANARNNLMEIYNTNQSIDAYSEVMESYERINYKIVEEPRVPYSANKVTPEALKAGFKIPCIKKVEEKHHRLVLAHVQPEKKALIVLSLKSAFYLNDDKINLISEVCDIQRDDLYTIVQEIKTELLPRIERKHALEERRNKTYYSYCRYLTQSSNLNCSKEKKDIYSKKAEIFKEKLDHLNEHLNKGIYIRPSNKLISEIIGVSERQISYYIKYAKSSKYIHNLVGEYSVN